MKKLFIFITAFALFMLSKQNICLIKAQKINQNKKIISFNNELPTTFEQAKKELKNLLEQREKVLTAEKELLNRLNTKYMAGGVLLKLREQLQIIRTSERLLINKISQLMKRYPKLMEELPPDTSMLPIIPFVPIMPRPLKSIMMPQL